MSDDKMISSWCFKYVTANLALFQSEVLNKIILMQLCMQTHSLIDTSVISSLKIVVLYLGIGVWGVKFASRLSLGFHFLFYSSLGCRFVVCAPWTSNLIFVFLRIDNPGDYTFIWQHTEEMLEFLDIKCSDSA